MKLPKREQKVLTIFTEELLDRLMRACYRAETAEYSMRDRTMLALLLDTGIRANELCGLTLDRLSFTAEDAYLLVNGKGRKQHEVSLGKRARQLVHKYVHRYRPKTESRQVFHAKGGTPLTTGGLDRVLYRLRDRAGRDHFQGVRVSAHTFRHTYVVRSLEAGAKVSEIQARLGHTSLAVTGRYLASLKSAVNPHGDQIARLFGVEE